MPAQAVDADEGVHVVGRGADDGVDLFEIKQLVKVFEELGLGVGLAGVGGAVFVHVAEGVDVLTGDVGEVVLALALRAAADDADVEALAGRLALFLGERRREW